jgi:hypothetical protein
LKDKIKNLLQKGFWARPLIEYNYLYTQVLIFLAYRLYIINILTIIT